MLVGRSLALKRLGIKLFRRIRKGHDVHCQSSYVCCAYAQICVHHVRYVLSTFISYSLKPRNRSIIYIHGRPPRVGTHACN
jgi:hypothetical protein